MSSTDSSDEDEECHLEFWNDWRPSMTQTFSNQLNSNKKKQPNTNFVYYKNETFKSVSTIKEDVKFGNWIPPVHFLKNNNLSFKRKITKEVDNKTIAMRNEENQICLADRELSNKSATSFDDNNKWKKTLNLDWGKRIELHDMTNCKDGELVWGMVNLGLFSHIKLYVNEYANICGFAEGTISKVGCSEVSFISITNTQLLRKMLNISSAQWASLCEVIQQTKTILIFEALRESDMNNKTSLEKLWFFLCKRRHFMPDQCMLVKLSGAVKCLREFRITPKLIVQDIRNIKGQPIS